MPHFCYIMVYSYYIKHTSFCMNTLKAPLFLLLRCFALLFICYLVALPLQAQRYRPGSPFITHFPKTIYQAGTQNWSIQQDSRGIMYIGNNHGVLEYDGESWRKYELPNRTNARSLSLAKNGRLYVGGQGALGYFESDQKGELLYHSILDFVPENHRKFDDVWKIFATDQGLIGLAHQQIMKWQGSEVELILAEEGNRFDNAYMVGDKLYIHDWQKGLMELSNAFTLKPVKDGEKLSQTTLAAILPDSKGELLIATAQAGLMNYDGNQFTPGSGPSHDFLVQNQAYCGIRLHNGNFAFGSPQNGMIIADATGQIILHKNTERGLANNTILSIFEDQQGHIWLGLDNGLNYLEINSPLSNLGPAHGISGTGYTSILHQGKAYLGTNQGLFIHDWPANGPLNFKLLPQLAGQVWSISDIGDSIWIGHHNGAFFQRGSQPQQLSREEGAWKFLPLASHPGYAVGGTYDGLVRYQKQGGRWVEQGPIPGFSESSRVMEEDENGDLWVTHFYRGVFKLTLDANLERVSQVISYDSSQGLPSSFSVNVSKIYNELIFTTLNGVFKYNTELNKFRRHPVLDSVFSDNPPRWLWEAPNGKVWFSAGKNFGYLDVENKGLQYQFKPVLLNRLQPSLVEGFEHVFPFDDQNVFIATEGGFVHFDPTFSSDRKAPLNIHIREVRNPRADSAIYLGGKLAFSEEDSLWKFPSNQHALQFSYSATQFSEHAHTQYRYQLVGFDDRWSDWDDNTEKEYSFLPHDSYTFNVQARNDRGDASPICSFSFQIATPWYLKPGAKFLWGLIFIGVMGSVFLLNKRRMSQRADDLLEEKTVEMQKKEAAYQQAIEENEAEILQLRNEKLRTEIDYKKQELAGTTMHLLQKSEILFKIKNELTKLSKQLPDNQRDEVKQIVRTIEQDIKLDENWNSFEHHFDQVHEDFIKRLRETYPQLTPKDLKLAAYLRMNLVTKEIAPLLNISVRGVEISRYRLRKKLNLDRDTNLIEYMMAF